MLGALARPGVLPGFDERPVPLPELARLRLGLHALGDVVDHAQPRRPAVELEIEGDDLDVDLLAVLLAVARHALHIGAALILKIAEQLGDLLRVAQLLRGHRQELLPRVAVVVQGCLIDREKTQGLVLHDPHRVRMDVEQHPVALLAVLQRLLRARPVGDVLADTVVSPELSLRVENRLPGHAQILQLAARVGTHVDKIAERFMTLELVPVLLPDFTGERRESGKLPARLANEEFLFDASFFDAGQLDEAEILVLHPIPVRAHLHHAAEPGFARLAGVLGELKLGAVVKQSDEAPRGTGTVPEHRARDAHPDGGAVLAQIALFVDTRLGQGREKLLPKILDRLQIVCVRDVLDSFLQELVLVVAEQAAQRFVYAQEAAVRRADGYADRGLTEERTKQGVAVRNGAFILATWTPRHESRIPPRRSVSCPHTSGLLQAAQSGTSRSLRL